MFRIEANLPDECGFEYRQSSTMSSWSMLCQRSFLLKKSKSSSF